MNVCLCKTFLTLLLLIITGPVGFSQSGKDQSESHLNKSWKQVALNMPEAWYGTTEAREIAQHVVQSQKAIGGWPKNIEFHHLSATQLRELKRSRFETGATFDNGATTRELRFLIQVYAHSRDPRIRRAIFQGLNYLFRAQYANGGWPQFYPVRSGNTAYSGHITYNDDSMVNILRFLKDLNENQAYLKALNLPDSIRSRARNAFDDGIDCILNTQIIVRNKPTVWCAQHDSTTLSPAKARSYELASFSGSESVEITRLLMELENPSQRVITAIDGAVEWFETHQLENIRVEVIENEAGKPDKVVVQDRTAPPIWARFYDLETGNPFFCDRDGLKRFALAEIGYERRNGYRWYTRSPAKLLKEYPEWQKRVQRLRPHSSGKSPDW